MGQLNVFTTEHMSANDHNKAIWVLIGRLKINVSKLANLQIQNLQRKMEYTLNISCYVIVSRSVMQNHLSTWQKGSTICFTRDCIVGYNTSIYDQPRISCLVFVLNFFFLIGENRFRGWKNLFCVRLLKLNLDCMYFSLIRECE